MNEQPKNIIRRWKHFFRHIRPLLGPKPIRTSIDTMRTARRIILEKRDNIGDFVLATAFFNEAYRRWSDRDVTLACTAVVAPLAQSLYPSWRIQIAADLGTWNPEDMRREVSSWRAADLLVTLRSIRHQTEMIFSSWIAAESKLSLANQFHYEDGQYVKVSDRRVYSQVLQVDSGFEATVCKELRNHRKLIEALFPDVDPSKAWPSLEFDTGACVLAKSALKKNELSENMLLLVPFPSAPVRSYPEKKLLDAATKLAVKHGLSVGILGGKKDQDRAELMVRSLDLPNGVRNLAGALSLPELVEVIRGSKMVVGVDTGPMHVAVACGIPAVVILGGGHYGVFGPWGDPRKVRWVTHPMPCFDCNWSCIHEEPHCIRKVCPEEIVQAAEEVMPRGP